MKLRNYLYLRSDVAGDRTQYVLAEMRRHLRTKGIGQCTEIIANGPAGFNTVYHTVNGPCPTLVLIPSLPHLQGRLDELRSVTHVQALDTQIIWGTTSYVESVVVVESTRRPRSDKSVAEMVLTALMQAEVDAVGAAAVVRDGVVMRSSPPLHLLESPEAFRAAYAEMMDIPTRVYDGFVQFCTSRLPSVLFLPAWLAEPVARRFRVPTLGSVESWRLIVELDRMPTVDEYDMLEKVGGVLCAYDCWLSLPTTPARREVERCWWVQQPVNGFIPPLSMVLEAALTGHLWQLSEDRKVEDRRAVAIVRAADRDG